MRVVRHIPAAVRRRFTMPNKCRNAKRYPQQQQQQQHAACARPSLRHRRLSNNARDHASGLARVARLPRRCGMTNAIEGTLSTTVASVEDLPPTTTAPTAPAGAATPAVPAPAPDGGGGGGDGGEEGGDVGREEGEEAVTSASHEGASVSGRRGLVSAASAEDVPEGELDEFMETCLKKVQVEKEEESEEAAGDHNLEGPPLQRSRYEARSHDTCSTPRRC